ncbi:Hypothetical protein A7982_04333 [Minicystis rosea]|nr:Hypothetical protein A7982_04333 [Minicystis rosea]
MGAAFCGNAAVRESTGSRMRELDAVVELLLDKACQAGAIRSES